MLIWFYGAVMFGSGVAVLVVFFVFFIIFFLLFCILAFYILTLFSVVLLFYGSHFNGVFPFW